MDFYQYKVTKKGEKPPVWRRCLIPADITFAQLAMILDDVVDAKETLRYEFEFKTSKIFIRENEETESGYEELDAKETFVSELADGEAWFSFCPDCAEKKGSIYRIDRETAALNEKGKQEMPEYPVIVKESEAAQKAFPTKLAAKNKVLRQRYSIIREAASVEETARESLETLIRRREQGEYGIVTCPGAKSAYSRNDWMLSCQLMLSFLYGSAPIGVMHEMYRQREGFEVSRLEFMDVFRAVPKEQNFCVVQDGRMIQKEALEDDIYKRIESRQGDCSFYMPNVEEIMVYSRKGYPAVQASYEKLYEFFEKEEKLSVSNIEELMRLVYKKFSLGCDMEETLEALGKEGVAAGEGLRGLLAAAQADTRMLTLRGHTVSEWRQEEAAKKQEEDRRKGAGRTLLQPRRKIYPNEPCPCGSGRKYKKCCAGK